MTRVFSDTNVPVYAAARESGERESCRKVLEAVARGRLEPFTDAETFQEIPRTYLAPRRARDLNHVAARVAAGAGSFVSVGRDFERFADVERVDSVQLAARLRRSDAAA